MIELIVTNDTTSEKQKLIFNDEILKEPYMYLKQLSIVSITN